VLVKTLVLGGYGNFGARICRALAGDPAIDLVVGGRDAGRAARFAASLGRDIGSLAIDLRDAQLVATLCDQRIELVIHTAGPFQQQSYGVAGACAEAGAHYLDLADGRRFVCDFPAAMDAAFRDADRVAVSGASTVPALSSAVVGALTTGWQRIDAIDLCIAPAQTAPRGVATLEAVLSYCGESISVWSQGRWQTMHGWAEPEPVRFHRLATRRGALCDIPDLEIFPRHYRVAQRVIFRAALEVGLAQWGFAGLAAARRAGLIRRPERFARALHHAAGLLDGLGSSLGGMVVRVAGSDRADRAARRAWHIAAPDDHGPEIPCMPAILLARRLARGEAPKSGACTSTGLLRLEDFAPEFERWGMQADLIDEPSSP
jgi:hypothetical protein